MVSTADHLRIQLKSQIDVDIMQPLRIKAGFLEALWPPDQLVWLEDTSLYFSGISLVISTIPLKKWTSLC